MYIEAVTDVTGTCDGRHDAKLMMGKRLRAHPAGVAVTAGDGGEIAQIHGVLERHTLGKDRLVVPFLLTEHGMAGVAVLADDFAICTLVVAIVAAKTSGKVEVPDVVVVRAPIELHLRECGVLVEPL